MKEDYFVKWAVMTDTVGSDKKLRQVTEIISAGLGPSIVSQSVPVD